MKDESNFYSHENLINYIHQYIEVILMNPTPRKLTIKPKSMTDTVAVPSVTGAVAVPTVPKEKYQKLEHIQHVLLKPEMYIGSTNSCEQDMFIYDDDVKQMIKKKTKFVPGLYKLYDEGIVNMRDHHIRMRDLITLQADKPNDPSLETGRKYYPVKSIEIEVDLENNQITFKNDGDGIDVRLHSTENVMVPELIFGQLLTGTNFNQKEEKTVGGQNGYGAKLINLLSSEFTIETVDAYRGLKFFQRYSNNMSVKDKAEVTPCKSKPYTVIKFKPDFKRFGLSKLSDDDTVQLMRKRAYDLAACTSKDVTVTYNGQKIEVKTFERYVDMYIGSRGDYKRIYSQINPDWEIAVCASPDNTFEHVSFVNGICTYRGGKHIDHASNIISTRLAKYASENKKGMNDLTPKSIKDNMWLFINTTMVNPSFDTQTKEFFTTNITDFRSRCEITDDFIAKLSQSNVGLLEKAIKLSEFKAGKGLKKTDGKVGKRIKNEKVDDAIYARDKKRCQKCSLILTEGDSAQSTAMAGLSVLSEEERKYYGVMPLRGKIINPKDSKVETIEKNTEFVDIKQVLGLKQGSDYSNSQEGLRYGRVILMTDADVDGDHIKALGFNLFHEFWPSLLKIDGFLCSLLTPIVKATHNTTKKILSFYSIGEYNHWKQEQEQDINTWSIKYYKGLGTHTPNEAKECFREMKLQKYSWNDLSRGNPHGSPLPPSAPSALAPSTPSTPSAPSTLAPSALSPLSPSSLASVVGEDELVKTGRDDDDDLESEMSIVTSLESFKTYYKNDRRHPCDLALELAFSKKNADFRKGWITNYLQLKAKGEIDLDLHKLPVMSYYDFINEKFIDFSVYDNERSIPSIADGLKPSQRKIIYTTLYKKIKKDLKVSELAGQVSSSTSYHHGEASLQETIVGLAQDFPGSNNINVLLPIGQFGTRKGDAKKGIGKDYAASRYIYTNLNPLTRYIFNKTDDNLYQYLDDDGTPIEPRYYVPIIPLVLVNGARGIGTGWMTDIPSYNPWDIIENVERFIQNQPFNEIHPWFRGFRGSITKTAHQKYKVTGIYHRTGQTTVEVVELPIGSARESMSFMDYKNFIDSLVIDDSVNDEKLKRKQILKDAEIIIGDKTIKCTLYFESANQLNELFADIPAFEKLFKLSHVINTGNMYLFNSEGIMTRYINPEEILKEYCQLRLNYYDRRKKYQVDQLEIILSKINEKIRFITYINDDAHELKVQKKRKVEIVQLLEKHQFKKFPSGEQKQQQEEADEAEEDTSKLNYDYLLKMPINSLTVERIEKLQKEHDQYQGQLDQLISSTLQKLWIDDLKDLKQHLTIFEQKWAAEYGELLCKKKITMKHK